MTENKTSSADLSNLRGRYLTIEGMEGSGKTTQFNKLVQWLVDNGLDVVPVKHPGTTVVGKACRELVLDRKKRLPLLTETLLFLSAIADTYEQIIIPALREGRTVVADRGFMTTIVHQVCMGNGSSFDALNMKLLVADTLRSIPLIVDNPDERVCVMSRSFTAVIAGNAEICRRRVMERHGENTNVFDIQDEQFYKSIATLYREAPDNTINLGSVRVIPDDQGADADTIHELITVAIADYAESLK